MKYLVKLSKFGGQYRVTLPVRLVEGLKWYDVEFLLLDDRGQETVYMRRFIDGESLEGPSTVGPDESNRGAGGGDPA